MKAWIRQGVTAIAALALAVTVTSLGASRAEARVGEDPCSSHTSVDFGPDLSLRCAWLDGISAWRTETLPGKRPWPVCVRGERLAGTTGTGWSRWTARWDFWSDFGQWVTWTGGGDFVYHDDGRALIFRPQVHNWWAGQWHVRLFQLCEAAGTSRGLTDAGAPDPDAEPSAVDVGDSGEDTSDGTAEDDVQAGRGGDDELLGGAGDDEHYAGAGDDALRGGSGDDQLLGGAGDDVSHGSAGSDELFDDEGIDALSGGGGEDRFSTHDGDRDRIACGGGEDVVVADGRDRVADDCEHVYRSREEAPKRPPV